MYVRPTKKSATTEKVPKSTSRRVVGKSIRFQFIISRLWLGPAAAV